MTGTAELQDLANVRAGPGPPEGGHRVSDRPRHLLGEAEVEPDAAAIPINALQQDLPGAELSEPPGDGLGVNAAGRPSTVRHRLDRSVGTPGRVDPHDDAVRPEPLDGAFDEGRVDERDGGQHASVGSGIQGAIDLVEAPNAASDRERCIRAARAVGDQCRRGRSVDAEQEQFVDLPRRQAVDTRPHGRDRAAHPEAPGLHDVVPHGLERDDDSGRHAATPIAARAQSLTTAAP